MSSIAIRCTSVVKSFGSMVAVNGVDLALGEGRILALLGPSGCGKTTTLRLLAGFETPDAGEIEIGGRVVAGDGIATPPERRKVGMVFQDYALFPHLDVASNVGYGLNGSPERETRVSEMLSLVGLEGLEKRMPHELSGGQQQRVALARALVPRPAVVLLDEPFSNLDASLRVQVRSEVRQILKAAGATAVFVTHDQEEALSLADEVALMLKGRVVQVGAPEELYHHPRSREVATFIGDADFLPCEVDGGRVCCELGVLPCACAPDGMGEVMLRPEKVALALDPRSPHEVTLREFYGHDQMVTIRLSSGKSVRCRLGPGESYCEGDRVLIHVRGEVTVYTANSGPHQRLSSHRYGERSLVRRS